MTPPKILTQTLIAETSEYDKASGHNVRVRWYEATVEVVSPKPAEGAVTG